jgi:2'-5' RNA ligase
MESDSEKNSQNTVPARPPRVFVALKLAPDIARELAALAAPLRQFGIRPIGADDLHLTLVPPWREPAPELAMATLRRVVEGRPAFALRVHHVGYGPDAKRPHFLWADCESARPLVDLRAALLDVFGPRDERPFHPHVTLARLHNTVVRVVRRCPIDCAVDLTQAIATVELMQSPAPDERGYRVLMAAPLQLPAA